MRQYLDVDRDSGVAEYEIGLDYIDVKFKSSVKVYRYSYRSAGMENVEEMKVLAKSGNGLNAFITRNVRDKYER